jgi:hypothetical protein
VWKGKARNAVYVVTVPESFRPERPWTFPDQISAGELYAKNLAMVHALGFVRTFNKRQLALNFAEHRWAIVVKQTKFHWEPEPGSAVASKSPASEPAETERPAVKLNGGQL